MKSKDTGGKKGLRLVPAASAEADGICMQDEFGQPTEAAGITQNAFWAAVAPGAGHFTYPAEMNNVLLC